MLHACFQLLTDCIDQEKLLTGNTKWDHDDIHKNAKKEIEVLNSWWVSRKEKDAVGVINDLEKVQYEQDDKMLIRLIKIRRFLWT